jgi:hypothetical protein
MKLNRWEPVVVAACLLAAGCASVTLTPGADQINVTRNAADTAACASLGPVANPQLMLTDPDADRQLRNETLALGGNTLLLTTNLGRSGIAYRCGDTGRASGQSPVPPATGTAAARTPAPSATTALQAPVEVVQAQLDAYNQRDLERCLSLYADDTQIFDYPDHLLMTGKDAIRDHYRKLLEPAPQLHVSILSRIAFDRFVVDRESVSGRPDGQTIEAVAIFEIRDGRIVRVTFLRH